MNCGIIFDIFWNFLATAFGVGLALFLQKLYDGHKAKDNICKAKENLIDELKEIARAFHEKQLANERIHFDTPVWRAVVSTGSILEILRKDNTFYTKLLEIYGKLFGLSKMEENFPKNEEEIFKLRREIVIKIKELVQWAEQYQSQLKNARKLWIPQMWLKSCKKK